METRYKVVVVNLGEFEQTFKFNKSQTFEQLKDDIGNGFYKGVTFVRLFPDYRKKDKFLQINKADFTPEQIEDSYKNIQRESKKAETIKRIDNLKSDISFRETLIKKYEKELAEL